MDAISGDSAGQPAHHVRPQDDSTTVSQVVGSVLSAIPGLGSVNPSVNIAEVEDGEKPEQLSPGARGLQSTQAARATTQEGISHDAMDTEIGIEAAAQDAMTHENTATDAGEQPSFTTALETLLGGLSPPPSDERDDSADVHAQLMAEATADANDIEMANGHTEEVQTSHPVAIAEQATSAAANDSAMMDHIPPVEMIDANMENVESQEAEFEVDSSPYESSSDDSSDDSSSEEDSDEDAYQLLDPAEQARILMEGDGGSDDEGGKGAKGSGGQLRTKNEVPEEVIPKPDVTITAEMKIEELGDVEAIVENMVLVKAKTSGEYRVLESGSVLCLEDRSVIGVVSETLGRVQQPLYCVRFTNAEEVSAAGLSKGTRVFYSEQHSTYVFTQALKAFKGSDASNLHDEEVGDEEIEFSDDEAEMEHKKKVKQKRLERRGGRTQEMGGRGGRAEHPLRQESYNAAAGISYDDDEDGPYRPLARPMGYGDKMGRTEAPEEGAGYSRPSGSNDRPREPYGNSRGRGGDRGRGNDRGRGRGSDRGRGRPAFQDRRYPPAPADAPQDPRKNPGYNPSAPPPFAYPPAPPQQHAYPPPPFQFPQQPFAAQQNFAQQPYVPYPPAGTWAPPPPQLPAGAFINPAFFGGQQQTQWTPMPPAQFGGWTAPQQQQQQQTPEGARALAEAQEKLRILRENMGGPR